MNALAGLVLVGGGSRRFGTDKALAVVDGDTLLDRAVGALHGCCDGAVVLASGDGRSRPGVADGEVADLDGASGPLAGIGAGLLALRGEAPAVAVLAVDVLSPSPALFGLLAARLGDHSCAVPVVAGWRQPLHAVWSVAVAPAVGTAVAAGVGGPTGFLAARRDVLDVDEDTVLVHGIDPAQAAVDVDRPGDLPN